MKSREKWWHVTPTGQIRRCRAFEDGTEGWYTSSGKGGAAKGGDYSPYDNYACGLTRKDAESLSRVVRGETDRT